MPRAQGNLVEAVPLMREAVTAARATLGLQHEYTLTYVGNLADMLRVHGKFSEAEALYREAREALLATLGPQDPATLAVRTTWGLCWASRASRARQRRSLTRR